MLTEKEQTEAYAVASMKKDLIEMGVAWFMVGFLPHGGADSNPWEACSLDILAKDIIGTGGTESEALANLIAELP